MDLAVQEARIVLTEDKDFGQLVYASARESGGVIFIRFPSDVRSSRPSSAVQDFERALNSDQLGEAIATTPRK